MAFADQITHRNSGHNTLETTHDLAADTSKQAMISALVRTRTPFQISVWQSGLRQ